MIRSDTDHAANERTFLAWVRTGLTIMALGFVMERLDLLLASLGLAAQGREVPTMGQAEIHGLSVGLGLDRGLELPVSTSTAPSRIRPCARSRARSCRSARPPCCLRSASDCCCIFCI